ncbi:ABC transporter permease [Arthrobacter caoxuetaonis]|uniref:ABC transporter permease subunit n=1 Tax=Arthrobacter caoxuetaonis TaxID=2886935 RepID=A0A9X1MD72_9MICC|nr:ABC transporter permease subunit [Arthrobacter caoxuetaonis]MCC3296644.1 ABC transporter permease subunit [Arthrobacter caoxuetaonis]USQ56529.1 ABC transporter permease subunit [Arthrobacter caoxuetaonis]
MDWFFANTELIGRLTALHLYQAVIPLLLGVLIAIPLAQAARLHRGLGGFILGSSAVLYTIPSLALFVLLPVLLGTRVLDITNVIVALTLYAVALLVRSTVDALNSVDDDVRQAATAMGYRPLRRFFAVDLPLAVPVLFAGLRVISVSNMSLVSVGALLGIDSLGRLFMDGLYRNFPTEIVIGIALILLLALVLDLVLVLAQRLLTPWTRAARNGVPRLPVAAVEARTAAS